MRPDGIQEEFPAPICALLGLPLIRDEVGRAIVKFEASNRRANPIGCTLALDGHRVTVVN
jgi:hypothetical protein